MKHSYFIVMTDQILCAVVSKKNPESPQSVLQETIQIDSRPILQPMQKALIAFINKHQLQGNYAHMAFMHPLVYENCFIMNKATAMSADFTREHTDLQNILFQYTYLHPLEDGKHRFYVCGVTPATLFFYNLLLISCGLHVTRITTSYIALLQAYKNTYQHAFRHAQLAADMAKTGYNIEKLFTQDTIARSLFIPTSSSISAEHDKEALLTLIGLIHMKESMYGY